MPVDGVAAARTLLTYDGIRGGYCLFYVWQAYKARGASTGRSAGTASEAWNRSNNRHPGDRNPPPGVPVFWGPKASSNAGDVVISLGNGRVAATDWPRYGVTGICTIDERERQIGRPYLGWAECIFDQPIALPTTAGETGTPLEEEDMTPDQAARLERIEAKLNGALSSENQTQLFQDVVATRSLVEPVFHALMDGRPEYYEGKYNALQILLSVSIQTFAWTQRNSSGGADVDENQLAAELAPLLGPLLVENLGSLSEETLASLTTRIADEQDRRARERLGS